MTAPPTATAGSWEVVFHRDKQQVVRPIAVAIAAGAAHSCVATSAGAVLAWRSMDPALQAVEVGGQLAGRAAACVAAGAPRLLACCIAGVMQRQCSLHHRTLPLAAHRLTS